MKRLSLPESWAFNLALSFSGISSVSTMYAYRPSFSKLPRSSSRKKLAWPAAGVENSKRTTWCINLIILEVSKNVCTVQLIEVKGNRLKQDGFHLNRDCRLMFSI